MRAAALALLAGAALAACSSFSPEARVLCRDPDRQLAEALAPRSRPLVAHPGHAALCAARDDEGRCREVRRDVERLGLICPRHVPTLLAAASLAVEASDTLAARRYLDEVAALAPRSPATGILRARLALADGNLRHARRLLEDDIRLAPDHAGLRETLAGVLYLQRRFEDARAALAIAARLGTPGWRVAYNLGLIEEALGNLEQAARRYEEALRERPDWPAPRARLAGLRAL
jgi:tetratricopeptide (TPR) repeat protein